MYRILLELRLDGVCSGATVPLRLLFLGRTITVLLAAAS